MLSFYWFSRVLVDSDESEDEKPKPKPKGKKSVGEDVTEVTKNLTNVSISNKSQKKKVEVNSDGKFLPTLFSQSC